MLLLFQQSLLTFVCSRLFSVRKKNPSFSDIRYLPVPYYKIQCSGFRDVLIRIQILLFSSVALKWQQKISFHFCFLLFSYYILYVHFRRSSKLTSYLKSQNRTETVITDLDPGGPITCGSYGTLIKSAFFARILLSSLIAAIVIF